MHQSGSLPTFIKEHKEMFYLTMHSTHFIFGYMASDILLRTILIVRKKTRCCHIGYSFRLAARVLLYAPSHRQDNTYHSLCYTSRGALAGTRNNFHKMSFSLISLSLNFPLPLSFSLLTSLSLFISLSISLSLFI